ncbi:MAG: hypothetical protein ACI4GC_04030 [Acutalibacteraceae bacterium]
MEFNLGQVVVSLAGHDKGELYAVTGLDKNRVLVCNGKDRALDKAKAKNPKHLKCTDFSLDENSMATNRKLRKQLMKIATYGG